MLASNENAGLCTKERLPDVLASLEHAARSIKLREGRRESRQQATAGDRCCKGIGPQAHEMLNAGRHLPREQHRSCFEESRQVRKWRHVCDINYGVRPAYDRYKLRSRPRMFNSGLGRFPRQVDQR